MSSDDSSSGNTVQKTIAVPTPSSVHLVPGGTHSAPVSVNYRNFNIANGVHDAHGDAVERDARGRDTHGSLPSDGDAAGGGVKHIIPPQQNENNMAS